MLLQLIFFFARVHRTLWHDPAMAAGIVERNLGKEAYISVIGLRGACLTSEPDDRSELVMAGLVPAIHVLLRDSLEQVVPVRIGRDNQPDFPGTRPMLDVVFTLDRILNGLEFLEIDEPLQAIALGKAFDEAGSMFKNAPNKAVRHADIKNAVRTISHEIDIATSHAEILQDVDGRDKPGHDDGRGR